MKYLKFFSFFLMLVVMVFPSFAELAVEPKITATAEAKFGVDLDTIPDKVGITTGFESYAEFSIEMLLRDKKTEEFGEGDIYGWIKVEDVKITIDSDTHGPDYDSNDKKYDAKTAISHPLTISWGAIEAEIRLGPMVYISLTGGDFDTGKAREYTVITGHVINIPSGLRVFDDGEDIAGVAIGFNFLKNKALNIELGLASQVGALSAANNPEKEDSYYVSLETTYKSFMDIDFLLGIKGDWLSTAVGNKSSAYEKLAMGVSLSKEIPIILDGDISLKPFVGVEFGLRPLEGSKHLFDIQAALSISAQWDKRGVKQTNKSVGFFDDDVGVTSGVGIGVVYVNKDFLGAGPKNDRQHFMYAKVALYEDDGDKGIIPMLGASLIFDLYANLLSKNLVKDLRYGTGFYTSLDVGKVDPHVGLIYRSSAALTTNSPKAGDLQVKVGLDITELVANTTFSLDWESGNILQTTVTKKGDKLFQAATDEVNSNITHSNSRFGRIYLGVKVEF